MAANGKDRSPRKVGYRRRVLVEEFDERFYRSTYPDLSAHPDPLGHFIGQGWREGRDPNADFSTRDYLAAYPEVRAAEVNPFLPDMPISKVCAVVPVWWAMPLH